MEPLHDEQAFFHPEATNLSLSAYADSDSDDNISLNLSRDKSRSKVGFLEQGDTLGVPQSKN